MEEDTEVRFGDRYGIIRFGSRADVYLPLKTAICVTEGQTSVGGETIIADLRIKKTSELKFEKR